MGTLCQHNPPVQKQLLELGSIKILSDLFFQEIMQIQQQQQQQQHSIDNNNNNNGVQFASKIMQAISANIRSYDLAETLFLSTQQNQILIEMGLGMHNDHDHENNNNNNI